MREVTIAITQTACGRDRQDNIARAEALVREAAEQGANVILLPELFETRYFCQDESGEPFDLAAPAESHPTIAHMSALAADLGVVIPVSFFERHGNSFYNSVAIVDADGRMIGVYRKSHIPFNPGYYEKHYFAPGDSEPQVWPTRFGVIGLGICWDQWFPEFARAMVLRGAEYLLFPSAIGSEPSDPDYDSMPPWRRVMQGHAAANLVPVAASNRVGVERGATTEITFYGASFVADAMGAITAGMGTEEGVKLAAFDLDGVAAQREAWSVFRDRRPELYGLLSSAEPEG